MIIDTHTYICRGESNKESSSNRALPGTMLKAPSLSGSRYIVASPKNVLIMQSSLVLQCHETVTETDLLNHRFS